jgi:hypothetical protein
VSGEGTGAATPPENKSAKPSSNLAAWLAFAGAIFGGIVTIVVAIINKPGGPEKPTVQLSPTAIAATTASATASGGVAAQKSPPAPTEKEQDDAALTKLLIGRWQSREFISGAWVDQKASYAQSHTFDGVGTFVGVGTIKNIFTQKSYNVSGNWQIRGKRLYWEIDRSDLPELLPTGAKGANPIIKLTNDEFVFDDPALGRTRTWNRQETDDN